MYRADAAGGEGLAAETRRQTRRSSQFSLRAKRAVDIVGALFFLVAFFWLFLGIALAIRVTMGGPVIFAHRRIGRSGGIFPCLKFRSMLPNSEKLLSDFLDSSCEARQEWNENFKLKNDPRITKLGRLLRSTSLDELPQFINVLLGDMSLVGPRPVTAVELKQYYGADAVLYLSMRPGLTGLWQVQGRSDLSYRMRVDLDSRYVRQWSLLTDLRILCKTVAVVLFRRGAH